nr:HlyD family efflux transporter periplasmic adaptor subunit [Nannocystis sp. RBIL2]
MRIDLARTSREEAELQRVLAAKIAALATLDHQIDQHSLRAPIAGRLGGVVPLQAGAVLARGAVVAVVIPDDPLRIVGRFTPAGVGRIRPGQPARMRLDGFPWTEFGSLHGRVAAVASEAEDGLVRVECDMSEQTSDVSAGTGSKIPAEHGLTGVLEIEVESVSPAALLLRTIGQALAP